MRHIEEQEQLILKLKNKFYYDDTSKSCLRFTSNSIKPYQEAGSVDIDTRQGSYRRWRVRVDGINYLAHRVVWLIVVGPIADGFEIDHIDGNALNNKIDNLREIEKSKNRRNSRKRKDNKTGFTGVQYFCNGYRAVVKTLKKSKSKFFAIRKYGEDDALRNAVQWRQEMIEKLNRENAGYTDRHGK